MKSPRFLFLLLSAACVMLQPARLAALSNEEAAAGRALVQRYADAVVAVEMVVTVKLTMGERAMPPRESKVEVNGTVIAANGLTVTALSSIDPRITLESMRNLPGAQKMEVGETEYKEVKLRLANGSEVPAVVVLKDADLDLAFIAPANEAEARTFPFVALDQVADGAVLDQFYSVSRASKNLQRTPLVRVSSVTGIMTRPRKLFMLTEQAIGAPIFDAAGRVLGVTTQYLANGRPSGLVTLPAADVAEIAKQAAAIKPESANPPAPAPAPAEPVSVPPAA